MKCCSQKNKKQPVITPNLGDEIQAYVFNLNKKLSSIASSSEEEIEPKKRMCQKEPLMMYRYQQL